MSMVIVNRSDIVDVANEIRTLSGTNNEMSFNDMKETLRSIDVSSGVSNCKIYEITLAKTSGWVKLLDLDDDVLAHINNPSLVVSLVNMSGYAYEQYSIAMATASNTPYSMINGYPVYGAASMQTSETSASHVSLFYPPNSTDTKVSIGGYGKFRIDGSAFYYKPTDCFIRSGTYRLTFTW